MSGQNPVSTYDEVPYPSGPFFQSHPCHLAAVARLFGLESPPVESCRVLELGCAAGGNLLPMALDFPTSQFVGIDLSARQIEDGTRFLSGLPAPNLELRHCSITDVDASFGAFDYIICHGVYSWVPRDVQERILAIGRDLLSPGGVMYVSYNTQPGWHLRGVVRDMMRYHADAFTKPEEKIGQSRALLDFLVESANTHSEAYRTLLKDEAEILKNQSDSYLFHEHLEEVNEPLYFYQFMERAEAKGLRYLGDANFSSMLTDQFTEETASILRDAPLQRQEQYMDFLTARTFRMTLLCHEQIVPDRAISPTRVMGLSFRLSEKLSESEEIEPLPASDTEAASGSDSNEPRTIFSSERRNVSTSQPLTKSAVRLLIRRWPDFFSARELVSRARAETPAATSQDEYVLLNDLMMMLSRDIVQVALQPPPICNEPGDLPTTTTLARRMAELGPIVTNRAHRSVALDDIARFVLILLDGKHSRSSLCSELSEAIRQGRFRVTRNEQVLDSVDRSTCNEILDHVLQGLVENSLIVD